MRKFCLVAAICFTMIVGLVAAEPVKSMLGASDIIEESVESTASLYVQEGLVFHFDGIENAGYGIHSSSHVIDLISGNEILLNDYVYSNTNYWGEWSILDDRIVSTTSYDGTWGYLGDNAFCSMVFSKEMVDLWNNEHQITLEFVGEYNSSTNTSRWYLFGFTNCVAGYRFYDREFGGSGGASASYQPNVMNFGAIVDDFDNSSLLSYRDGKLVKRANSTGRKSCNREEGQEYKLFGPSYNSAREQNYLAIRIYNRALTPEEIAYNAALDAERFGLQ